MWKTITINNDHKEKRQSFTAKAEFEGKLSAMFAFSGFEIEAWGATEEEALQNLRTALRESNELLAARVDFTKIQYINGLGEPITKNW